MRWTLLIPTFLFCGAVQAADPSPPAPAAAERTDSHETLRSRGEERWQAADKDGNGTLSRAEAEASLPRLAQDFDQADADHDGQVSHDEARALHAARKQHTPEQMRAHFEAADTNADGAIDLAEAQSAMPKLAEHFAAVDTSHDGRVTPQEMKAHKEQMRARRAQPESPPPTTTSADRP